MLLETDVNPNLIDFSGQTPLHHAAKNGHEEVARRLLEVTDASIIDSKGRTALKCARDNDHVSTARLLLSSWSGSDVCTDSQGKTLEDWMNLVGQLNGTDRLWGRSSSEPARLERISDLE
ncbi:ankyrin repeat domain-containing protein [Aspergillus candidus]|uniref:Ankyrin repeat-containing domain protein n=1 Tax=Aspergillus candidus TaxID=41067 RepID=A0A2I2FAD4_ASPCN|nr:ankyrin repeat-containing domain protein [Aspergillus candidus]PLB37586.1 ankyrin repeat-containing domain protein [Aspergillus candidus]